MGYFGISLGSFYGVIGTALDPRFKASALLAGGLAARTLPAEIDPLNVAARIAVPTLMIGGNRDFSNPLETSQRPLYRAIGIAEPHKRYAILDGGHLRPALTPSCVRSSIGSIATWARCRRRRSAEIESRYFVTTYQLFWISCARRRVSIERKPARCR